MSHEVSLAYGDMRRVSELEAQIASAQAALLLAQADAETLRAAAKPIADQFEAAWLQPMLSDDALFLIRAVRAEHPGHALHDEVAAGRAERSARDTVIRDSISDILGRALAGYTEDFKLVENGQTYIRWGQVQDAIRALFDKEHPVADVMNHNRELQHQLTMTRDKLERAVITRNTAIARGAPDNTVAVAARAWAHARETLNGIDAAETALLAAVAGRETKS